MKWKTSPFSFFASISKVPLLVRRFCMCPVRCISSVVRNTLLNPCLVFRHSQKTLLLIEEKRIPVEISLVNMRSYGDKPPEFLRKVPGGLLPAIEVNGGQIITESQVIMELLDERHSPQDGYRAMMPSHPAGLAQYQVLARLERE
jgi:hypothetical protein